MDNIYINPSTKKMIDLSTKNLTQSLLLFGDRGIGLTSIGRYIAEKMGVIPIVILPEKDEKVDIQKGIISVEIMRRLYDGTRTIQPKNLIIIDYAERMTHQAQNAFLKLLEEPKPNIHFILLSHSISSLLPTVISRVQRINIKPISTDQSNKLLDKLGVTESKKRSQLLFIANGLPAELSRLANDKEYFTKRSTIVRDAREMLRNSAYQKIKIANDYKDDRESALRLLLDMANILKLSITDSSKSETIDKIKTILDAYQEIDSNCNVRICLTKVVI